jgi:tungstate transport system ATP-binding protein
MPMREPSTHLPIRFEGAAYAAGGTSILRDLTMTIETGAPTVLMGPNGAGKTTLLKLAMGLIAPTQGRITFAGREGASSPRRAFVFQKPVMLRRSVTGNIAFALAAAGRAAGGGRIKEILDQVRLGDLADRPARRLSGGEQQRLALARALARDPEVLFLDEPTASLDPAGAKAVEDIITRVANTNVKIVMATHHIGQARRLGGDVIFLANGRRVEHAPAATFFSRPATAAALSFLAGDLVI